MQPEERFDAVLDDYRRGRPTASASPDDVERLMTAERFAQLRDLHFPADFASRIEQRVRQRARALQTPTASTNGSEQSIGATASTIARAPWRRAAIFASVIALLCLVGGGIVNVYARSIPGDPLYAIKQWQNQIALNQANNPTARAQTQITQLDQAITDLSSEISRKRPAADINAALAIVISDTQQAQTAVTHLSTQDQARVIAALQQAKNRERAILQGALAQVPFSAKVAFTTQLGSLGETVLSITQITLTHETNARILLAVNGQHFQPGAVVIVDGTGLTPISATADTQLVTELATNQWAVGEHSVGVQNPDGTATLAANSLIPSAGGSNTTPAKGNGTPTPTPDGGNNNGHHHPTPTPKPTKDPQH